MRPTRRNESHCKPDREGTENYYAAPQAAPHGAHIVKEDETAIMDAALAKPTLPRSLCPRQVSVTAKQKLGVAQAGSFMKLRETSEIKGTHK